MKVQKFKSIWNLGVLAIYKFCIISDRKTISQRLLTFIIWFEVHIQPFFNSTNGLNYLSRALFFGLGRLRFQIHENFTP